MVSRGTSPWITLALTLALAGCAGVAADEGSEQEQSSAERPVTRVSGAEARQLVASGATLLDVRTPGEFDEGHIDGAVLVPVQELSGRMSEVPRDRPVVVYCRSGQRSATAGQMLARAGYEVHDLGSIQSW